MNSDKIIYLVNLEIYTLRPLITAFLYWLTSKRRFDKINSASQDFYFHTQFLQIATNWFSYFSCPLYCWQPHFKKKPRAPFTAHKLSKSFLGVHGLVWNVYHYTNFQNPLWPLLLPIFVKTSRREGKEKEWRTTRKERTSINALNAAQQPADKPSTLELLAWNTSRCHALGSLESPESKNGGSFRPWIFSSQRDLQHVYQETAPQESPSHDPTPGQPAAQDEQSAEFFRTCDFPYAAAFRREPARALGRRHPEASCASRGEDSVVGNYLTSSVPPSASSSSSQL